jgi:hypothetical protein
MQQLDGLDIAGAHISVKLAPLAPTEVQAAAVAAAGIDLDEAEGVQHAPLLVCWSALRFHKPAESKRLHWVSTLCME